MLQDPFAALNPRMQVGQIVGEPLRIHKINQPHRVAEVLAEVGLDAEYAERYPHQLSGGQRQRVAIARALAPRPRVILADEPVSALDVSLRVAIVDLLDELRRALNLTLVIVSHDIGVVQQLCEDVVVMKDGICVTRADARNSCATRASERPRAPRRHDALAHIDPRVTAWRRRCRKDLISWGS